MIEQTITPYRNFKGRIILNHTNGDLTLIGVTESESEEYTVYLNGKVRNTKKYSIKVIPAPPTTTPHPTTAAPPTTTPHPTTSPNGEVWEKRKDEGNGSPIPFLDQNENNLESIVTTQDEDTAV
ncbi:unnamed protein product [Boreogadus saida]